MHLHKSKSGAARLIQPLRLFFIRPSTRFVVIACILNVAFVSSINLKSSSVHLNSILPEVHLSTKSPVSSVLSTADTSSSNQSLVSQEKATNSHLNERSRRSDSTELVLARPFKATLASIFVRQTDLTVYYEIVKPAIELATEHCNRRFDGHIQLTAIIRNDSRHCLYTVAPSIAAELYYLNQINVFVGPACIYALDNVARLAAYWNVPVFTAGGSSVEFNDKTLFKTLSRLSFSLGKTKFV